MKNLIRILTLLSVPFLLVLPACDDDPTAEEKFMEQISYTWSATVITLDGAALTGSFENFSITFKNDKTFTTQNGNAPIWPASGSFTLATASSTPGFNLNRSDGVLVTVEELSSNALVLSLQYTAAGGRTASVSGAYEFQLMK